MYGFEGHGFGMVFSWLFVLLSIAFVVYYASNRKGYSSAKEILDQRYADGEIDTEEYQKRLKTLESSKKKKE